MTIAELGEKFDISQDSLRYYERIGLIPHVERKNGVRNYTNQDCELVEFIISMRRSGVAIEALIEYVELIQQGDETIAARIELFMEQYGKIVTKIEHMKKALEILDHSIEVYEPGY